MAHRYPYSVHNDPYDRQREESMRMQTEQAQQLKAGT